MLVRGCIHRWWQVLGSNQRRLSRRFYIPEEAGRGQVADVPVFVAFPGRVLGMPGGGPGPGGAPGWTNDLEAGPPPGSHWISAGNGYGLVGASPVRRSCRGRRAAAFIPSGCPWLVAAGAWGGSRAGSGINQTKRPPAGGGGQ